MKTPPKPVATYYRMSSEDQANSIDRQRAEVTAYCKARGYRIVAEYIDQGKSASSTLDLNKRTEFLRMLSEAPRSEWKVIVCWDIARFGRLDAIDGAFAKQVLRGHGVSLDSVKEGQIDWSTQEGRWKDMALSEQAHTYSTNLSKETISGRLRIINRQEWPNGEIPYGYDRHYSNGTDEHFVKRQGSFRKPKNWRRALVKNDREADIVQWIFHEFATKYTGLREIARQLNTRGVTTPDDGRRNKVGAWCKQTVRRILACKAYIGVGYIGTRPKARMPKFNAIPPTEVEGCCPVIIDRATWEKVQAKLADNSAKARNNQPTKTGLLSGFLYCSLCVKRLHKVAGVARRRGKVDYVCGTSMVDPKCTCRQWRVWEEEVLPKITTWLVEHVDFALLERMQARPETAKLDDEKITKELVEGIRAKLKRGSENFLLAPPELVPSLSDQLGQWRKELEAAEGRLSMIQATQQGGSMEQFGAWWESVRATLVRVAEPTWKPTGAAEIHHPNGSVAVFDESELAQPGINAEPAVLREFFRQIDLRASIRWSRNPEYKLGRGGNREFLPNDLEIKAAVSFEEGNVSASDNRNSCR